MKEAISGVERRIIELENITNTLVSIVLNKQQLTKEQQDQIGAFLLSPMMGNMIEDENESVSKNKRMFSRMIGANSMAMNSVININEIDKLIDKNNKLEARLRSKSRLNKFMTIMLPVTIILTFVFGFVITQNLYKRYSGESLRSAYINKLTTTNEKSK